MSNIKKIAAGLSVAALALVAVGSYSPAAHAQTTTNTGTNGTIFNSPISQWIVLSGLFGGNAFGYNTTNGTTQTTGANGTIFNSPISQWIVLSGLFGGNAFGYNTTNGTTQTTGANGTIFNNPISQWIVLSELFGNGYNYGY